jgi:tetratricopeptide (TPR) repeat protein
MLRALGDYTGLMLFPDQLHMERTLSDPGRIRSAAYWRTHARGEWLSVIGVLVIVGAIKLCRWKAPGRSLRVAGAAWFGIAFLPISNLFPLNAEVAEHWIYLASIGFILFLAGAIFALPARTQRWAAGAALLAIVALCVRTSRRSEDWVDAETFCRSTIASGGATPRILSTLAGIYAERGDLQKEEEVLRKTLARFPDFAPARMHLGICLGKQGRTADAENLLAVPEQAAADAARRFPHTWPAALNLAKLRHAAGDTEGTQSILRETRARFPEIWEVVRYQSEIVAEMDGARAALPEVERFAAGHWWHLDAWLTLGRFRFGAGDLDGAVAAFNHASRLDIYNGRPLASLAEVEISRHRNDAALAAQCGAIAREPERPARYLELGAILGQLGRTSEANAAVRKAQALAGKAGKS